MFEALDILNNDGYYALAIAILYRQEIDADDSFQLFDTGKIEHETKREKRRKANRDTFKDIMYMRKSGATWKEIGQVLGIRSPQQFFKYHQSKMACKGW